MGVSDSYELRSQSRRTPQPGSKLERRSSGDRVRHGEVCVGAAARAGAGAAGSRSRASAGARDAAVDADGAHRVRVAAYGRSAHRRDCHGAGCAGELGEASGVSRGWQAAPGTAGGERGDGSAGKGAAMKTVREEDLIAYHLGELSRWQRMQMRRRLERDPELAAESEEI